MGRARNSQQQVLAAGNFNSVLGRSRGSATAQARRDSNEQEQRDLTLDGFVKRVQTGLTEKIIVSATVEELVHTYRAEYPQEEVTAELVAKLKQPNFAYVTEIIESLASIIDVGDPALCPGLTAPAVQALCDYCSSIPSKKGTEGGELDLAGIIIRKVFIKKPEGGSTFAHELDYYLRLQKLIESLTPIILHPSRKPLSAVEALRLAPPSAVAGPLRSWVDTLAVAELSITDKRLLLSLVKEYEGDGEVEALAATAALAARL
jgi:hypothetical protein